MHPLIIFLFLILRNSHTHVKRCYLIDIVFLIALRRRSYCKGIRVFDLSIPLIACIRPLSVLPSLQLATQAFGTMTSTSDSTLADKAFSPNSINVKVETSAIVCKSRLDAS